jgi:hypothetical protein
MLAHEVRQGEFTWDEQRRVFLSGRLRDVHREFVDTLRSGWLLIQGFLLVLLIGVGAIRSRVPSGNVAVALDWFAAFAMTAPGSHLIGAAVEAVCLYSGRRGRRHAPKNYLDAPTTLLVGSLIGVCLTIVSSFVLFTWML